MFVPKSKTITIRLTKKEREQYEKLASDAGKKISTYCYGKLRDAIKKISHSS